MMLDNFSFFDIDDPKLASYKTNGSAGWCGFATKYVVYTSIIILGILIIKSEISNFGKVVGQSTNYETLKSDDFEFNKDTMPFMATVYFESKPLLDAYNLVKLDNGSDDFSKLNTQE